MRQGQQQNRRGRGRGGRKPQNSLSRNLESNGPDIKIRGTAAHIAEKYAALARDAFVSSDTVMAENYFQHAEHYNRIIMASQAQNPPAAAQQKDGGRDGEAQSEGSGQQSQPAKQTQQSGGAEAGDAQSGGAQDVAASENTSSSGNTAGSGNAAGRRRRRPNGNARRQDNGNENKPAANASGDSAEGFAGLPPSTASSTAKVSAEAPADAAPEKQESAEATSEGGEADKAIAS